jgi:hypothetical protein
MTRKKINKETQLIDDFMGNNTIKINVPFEYEKGDTLSISDVTCETFEDALLEVGEELDNGEVNSGTVYTEVSNYHTHWDMLIPVLQKIDVSEAEVPEDSNLVGDLTNGLLSLDIERTFEAAVEWIKWYNQNK